MKTKIILFISATLFVACDKDSEVDCNPKQNEDCICTMEYDPVCGCDGKTYGNACSAGCNNISYTKGAC